MRLPPLKTGLYRHYKGHLYLVLGYAHDANADTLFDAESVVNWLPHSQGEQRELKPLGERAVVVYVGLQLDDAKPGPRLAVRTVEDFFEYVDPTTGVPVDEATARACGGSVRQIEAHGFVPRFEYAGVQYNPAIDLDPVI